VAMQDASRGYDDLAAAFAQRRDPRIGAPEVRSWASSLPPGAAVLDVACGPGVPITAALIGTGCRVYAIDASPRMIAAFQERFPDVPARCESAETSTFFERRFDGVVAWGLLFLLPLEAQVLVIGRLASALAHGGSLLFTSPRQPHEWLDALTGLPSISPGRDAYVEMLARAGLLLDRECDDEGGNHYYIAAKNTTPADRTAG
jgi:SAM-dependent methyltransferase